jgi:biotin carboxyl carrier protein
MTSDGQNSSLFARPVENIPAEEDFISIGQLQHLVRLLERSDIAELQVKHGLKKASLKLRKAQPLTGESAQVEIVSEPEESHSESPRHMLIASHVGVFHAWSRSKDKPLAEVGDVVQEGQQVGVIRSLDIPNEVEAPIAGRISEIFVQDGQPVEYGQPLMAIDNQ